MKRVLITGGAGFLGSHLCDRFIKEGHYVIAMDNLITGDLRNIEHLFKHPNFEFYHHVSDEFKVMDIPHITSFIQEFLPAVTKIAVSPTEEITMNK